MKSKYLVMLLLLTMLMLGVASVVFADDGEPTGGDCPVTQPNCTGGDIGDRYGLRAKT